MKMSFNKVTTKKWKWHLEVWVAKRHLHGWLLAKPLFNYPFGFLKKLLIIFQFHFKDIHWMIEIISTFSHKRLILFTCIRGGGIMNHDASFFVAWCVLSCIGILLLFWIRISLYTHLQNLLSYHQHVSRRTHIRCSGADASFIRYSLNFSVGT